MNWWLTALLVVLSLTVLIPLYFAVVTALKTTDQLGGTGLGLPTHVQWSNFVDAWNLTNFPRTALNSAVITVGAVVLTLVTNSMVAYAIARNMSRRFFKGIYYYFVSALFVPFPIIMLPVAKQTALLHLDNRVGLILLYVVYGLAFNIFIFTAYIQSIPRELEEAATIDGASTWQTFWKASSRCSPDERHRRHLHVPVGLERLPSAAGHPVRPGLGHPAAGAVRLPEPVPDQLPGRVRQLPDGDGAAADRLRLRPALGIPV